MAMTEYGQKRLLGESAKMEPYAGPSRAPGDRMPDPRSVVQREFDRLMRDVERQKDRIAMARNTIKDEEAHLAALEAAALKFLDWLDRS